jgi:hypothetical protein
MNHLGPQHQIKITITLSSSENEFILTDNHNGIYEGEFRITNQELEENPIFSITIDDQDFTSFESIILPD